MPDCAEQTVSGDTLTALAQRSRPDFHADGLIAARLPRYEVRAAWHMARLVQRAIEMGEPAVIEAGTGWAKLCLRRGYYGAGQEGHCQHQQQSVADAVDRQGPAVLVRHFPRQARHGERGQNNYACRLKCDEGGVTDPALRQWYEGTLTGNIKRSALRPTTRALRAMTVNDECAGKHCPLYAQCFYYAAAPPCKGLMWL